MTMTLSFLNRIAVNQIKIRMYQVQIYEYNKMAMIWASSTKVSQLYLFSKLYMRTRCTRTQTATSSRDSHLNLKRSSLTSIAMTRSLALKTKLIRSCSQTIKMVVSWMSTKLSKTRVTSYLKIQIKNLAK